MDGSAHRDRVGNFSDRGWGDSKIAGNEPRHSLSHALRMCAETLDAVREGRLSLSADDVRTLEWGRDQAVRLLDG